MERLTRLCQNTENGKYSSYVFGNYVGIYSNDQLAEIVEKLADYEDLEEKGLLLKSPVTIGSVVFRINKASENPIMPMDVVEINIKGLANTFKEIKCQEHVYRGEYTYRFDDIGKTVFLTRKEAKQKLKELKGE